MTGVSCSHPMGALWFLVHNLCEPVLTISVSQCTWPSQSLCRSCGPKTSPCDIKPFEIKTDVLVWTMPGLTYVPPQNIYQTISNTTTFHKSGNSRNQNLETSSLWFI
ncbi:hypothetical protein DPMN_109365 [Dreissena polymorpha]|uniref:Uncharacterized protein n=1 Tax=Dreissena polymorpha TaxID=45954 RepID=A0A9D4QLW1_DREPO|nr:hypothetical protein DPMN_109365 [Dreissena polymorpha]